MHTRVTASMQTRKLQMSIKFLTTVKYTSSLFNVCFYSQFYYYSLFNSSWPTVTILYWTKILGF